MCESKGSEGAKRAEARGCHIEEHIWDVRWDVEWDVEWEQPGATCRHFGH